MKLRIGIPHITEKSMQLAQAGWYSFKVVKAATKKEIVCDIEQIYKVNVTDIRTISMHGKVRRAGKKQIRIKNSDWKKALVRLKSGQSIKAFEVSQQDNK